MTIWEVLRLALFIVGPTCILVGLRLRHSGRVRAEDRAARDTLAREAQQRADRDAELQRWGWALHRLDEQAHKYGQEV